MAGAMKDDGIARNYLGDFGEEWVKAVAAGCGYLQGNPSTKDLQRSDVQLTMVGEVSGVSDPTVQVQVKATEKRMVLEADGCHAGFSLDRKTYDALRNKNRTVRRVLAVIWVTKNGGHVARQKDGTLLVGHAAWVSLEELPETTNKTSVMIKVPIANTFDHDGLRRLLEEFGIPRSTPVPEINAWAPST